MVRSVAVKCLGGCRTVAGFGSVDTTGYGTLAGNGIACCCGVGSFG